MRRDVSLKIGSLNIQGSAKIKCGTADIISLVQKHHIFVIEESWLEKGDACPQIPSYTPFRTERKKHPKAVRNSGGIIMYIRNSIMKGITKVAARAGAGGDAIWIKLDKFHFGLNTHVFLCGGYIVPRADGDTFEILRREIEIYSNMGKVCLIGDYNARTASSQPIQYVMQPDNETDMISSLPTLPRKSIDKTINGNGNQLLKILTNYDLLIGNGYLMGDLEGNLTCSSWNGFSTNDLFVFHRDMYTQISYFKVDDHFQWYSDHRCITVSLRVDLPSFYPKNTSWRKMTRNKIIWNAETIEKYKNFLAQPDTIETFQNFNNSEFSDSNEMVKEFTSIMNKILENVFPDKGRRRKKLYKENRKEFSLPCQIAKRAFKRAQRHLHKDSTSIDRRHKFIVERRNYRRAIYAAKRISKEKEIGKLLDLEKRDTKSFWKGLKAIISPKDDSIKNIDKDEWINHFNEVLNVPAARGSDTQFLDYVKSSLPILENNTIRNQTLNLSISAIEISSAIKELKSGKAVYTDNIGNEALKHGFLYIKDSLGRLFNAVFQQGDFPSLWADGLIIPLHKKDDKMKADNYRGIIISSCISKVLLKILTKRIDTYMSQSGKWSLNQCGFKQDHRTEDNLFVLNTIYNKYVKGMKKDLYVAFIDFSKFFDKINREMMLYKLLKYNINGPCYNIIKSVYCQTGYQVKIGDDISPMFYGKNGLKQGCCMSPVLSNIYQNDMHDTFKSQDCNPVRIGPIELSSLSWADDLILVSLSKQGLQNCILKLEEYCKKWGLEINERKTKCMVMSSKRGPFDPIYIYNTPIDYVQSMVYLGFSINRNGNVAAVMQDRIAKATRVSHMILQALRTNRNVSSKLSMTLFDKQITPILLYGFSIWGLPKTHNLFYLEEQQEHLNTRNTVKNMLLSTLNRDVPFEYARRVGKRQIGNTAPRRILVKLKSYSDKLELFRRAQNRSFVITNFLEKESDIEKLHHDFCKKALNVSKYASNAAVEGELGRFPVNNTAKGLAIKYWLRMNSGTNNVLLNEAYKVCIQDNHEWIQGIQYLLHENGFGHVWNNPDAMNKNTFHKYLGKY